MTDFVYNIGVDDTTKKFLEWIQQEYRDWNYNRPGHKGGFRAFSAYLGISYQTVQNWINSDIKEVPEVKTISKIALKYPEIYEVLGMPIPKNQSSDEPTSDDIKQAEEMADEITREVNSLGLLGDGEES